MSGLTEQILRATAEKLIAAHEEASRTDDWIFFVDELYALDCVYTCQYAGVMDVTANGIDEIKATHYGRDMQVDMSDLTHQMKLCDDLDDAGLLSAQLKSQWVLPMKSKLAAQIARNQ